MVNPGTFQGSRGKFLLAQIDDYTSAVADGRINDAVADIQRRYLKRYPMSLPHDQEPTQEWLDQVDDDAPDPDPVEPDYESLDAESAKVLQDERRKEAELLKACKDAIKRRLHYIYTKNRDKSTVRDSKGPMDPVSALRARLTGTDFKQPRKKTPYNVWGPKNRERVDPVFNQRVKDLGADSSQHAAIRSAVYKELFEELPAATKEHWAHIATEEHEAAVKALSQKRKQGVSTAPEDRQQVITALTKIMEPVLDMLAEHTGWKFSLVGGGPEPADAGRLNMMTIHSGVMPGTVKVDFGAAERDAWRTALTPAFGRFIKRCYTISECRARALPEDHSCVSLNDIVIDNESQVHIHSFDIDDEHRAASAAAAQNQKGNRLFEGVASKGKKPTAQAQTGTPSPQVRFVPRLGKANAPQRVPPNSDGHPRHHLPFIPSPLSRNSITSSEINTDADSAISSAQVDTGAIGASKGAETGTKGKDASASSVTSTLEAEKRAANTPAPSTLPALVMPTPPATPFKLLPAAEILRTAVPPSNTSSGGKGISGAAPVAALRSPFGYSSPGVASNERSLVSSQGEPVSSPLSTHGTLATPPPTPSLNLGSTQGSLPAAAQTCSPAPTASEFTAQEADPGSPPRSLPPSPAPSRASSPIQDSAANNAPHVVTASDTTTAPNRRPSGTAMVPCLEDIEAEMALNSRKRKADSATSQEPTSKKRSKGSSAQRFAAGKTNSAPMKAAFDVALPNGCPDYVTKGAGLLTRKHLGLGWTQLVEAWLVFEENARYGKATMDKKLPATGRPQEVAEWIKNARKPAFMPKIQNIDRYSAKFLTWWRSIQPQWRLGDGEGELLRDGGRWDAIACAGANGILSALAALFFWGSEGSKDGAASLVQWQRAVEDMHVAIEAMSSELA